MRQPGRGACCVPEPRPAPHRLCAPCRAALQLGAPSLLLSPATPGALGAARDFLSILLGARASAGQLRCWRRRAVCRQALARMPRCPRPSAPGARLVAPTVMGVLLYQGPLATALQQALMLVIFFTTCTDCQQPLVTDPLTVRRLARLDALLRLALPGPLGVPLEGLIHEANWQLIEGAGRAGGGGAGWGPA